MHLQVIMAPTTKTSQQIRRDWKAGHKNGNKRDRPPKKQSPWAIKKQRDAEAAANTRPTTRANSNDNGSSTSQGNDKAAPPAAAAVAAVAATIGHPAQKIPKF